MTAARELARELSRRCAAQRLAMLESVLILSAIIANFEISVLPGSKADDVIPHCTITLGPKNGLPLAFRRVGPARF